MDEILLKAKDKFAQTVGNENVYIDEPMSSHTSFRTGGPADLYVVPHTVDEICEAVTYCEKNNIKYMLFGNGSNTLVTDKGIRGAVISLKGLDYINADKDKNTIDVGAGVSVIKLSKFAEEHGLSGLEFACGIPGTVGGAIFMNAGAYGGEFKDIVKDVKFFLPKELITKEYTNDQCGFSYRTSIFQNMEKPLILGGTLNLTPGNVEDIKAKMKENMESRNTKQPVNLPSAGSVFKREEGVIVAKLIDDAGLKGYKIGGAEVSTLHAGFIVNSDNATSQDILDLIDHVKNVIKEKYDVSLHEEIKIVGER